MTNQRRSFMSYIVYKTTNLINGKFYIGQHSLDNDEYLGSGIVLLKAIEKYGKENFEREILQEYCSKEEMDEGEKFWIEKLDARNNSIGYNIASGGNGGDTFTMHPNKDKITKRRKESLKKYWNIQENRERCSRQRTENNHFSGKKHSLESKDKISTKGRVQLSNNEYEHFKFLYFLTGEDCLTLKEISNTTGISLSRMTRYIKEFGWTRKRHYSKERAAAHSARITGSGNPMHNSNRKIREKSPKLINPTKTTPFKHSDETKRKMRKLKVGKKFMNNNKIAKLVNVSDIQKYLDLGWKFGKLKIKNRKSNE